MSRAKLKQSAHVCNKHALIALILPYSNVFKSLMLLRRCFLWDMALEI
jgi:hypothetical protein